MSEKRMFTNKIISADAFTTLPASTQCLYFHLCMSADDDGFSNNIRLSMFNAHATTEDFNTLVRNRFIIPFDSGVIVIKHWKMHNFIRSDRYHETKYLEEKSMIVLKENGVYSESGIPSDNQLTTNGIPNDNQMDTEIKLDKVRLGKNKDIYLDSIKEIVSYLNQVCGTKYRYQSEKTKEKIRARLNDGFTIDDFKTVIDRKFADWSGDEKMSKFLRPETLFGSKFEGYLNQKDAEPKRKPNAFNDNFEKRSYDFDDLERRLLGG